MTNPSASGTAEFDRCMFECEMTLNQHPVLETERLMLRYLTANDVDADLCGDWRSGDDEVLSAELHPRRRGGWIERNLERYRRDGYGLFAVVLKADGEVIGDCGLVRQEVEGELDAGGRLSPPARPLGTRLCDGSGAGLHGLCLSDA